MCIGCCCFPFCRLDACTGTGQVKHGPVFQTLLSIFMKSLTLVSARDSNTARQPMCRSAYAHAGWVGDYFQHLKAKPAELSGTTLIFSGILNGEDIAFLQKWAKMFIWPLEVGCLPKHWKVRSRLYRSRLCNERLMLQHFSRSTIFVDFCTAPNSTFAAFRIILQMIGDFSRFKKKSLTSYQNRLFFVEFFVEFWLNCGKS